MNKLPKPKTKKSIIEKDILKIERDIQRIKQIQSGALRSSQKSIGKNNANLSPLNVNIGVQNLMNQPITMAQTKHQNKYVGMQKYNSASNLKASA